MWKFIISGLAALFFLASCSSNNEYDVKTTETNGIKTVLNPDFPKEGTFDLQLQEIFTLGKEEDNSKYIFSMPLFIELDSKDNLYVADYDAPKYFVFNSRGEFIRSFGKKGADRGILEG